MGFFQPPIPLLPDRISLDGQTIIVTGATAGIGYEVSRQLLRLKVSTLILGVRNIQKGAAARLGLLADEKVRAVNPEGKVEVLELDLADYQNVVRFANNVLEKKKRLDVLILNAGINLAHFKRSPSEHEMCIQVNILSNALLSLLLLPLLQKTKATLRPPTITWVGSLAQAFNSLTSNPLPPSTAILPHYASTTHYSPLRRYSDTKLFVALFVRQMAQHLPVDDADHAAVIVNNVCPGTVNTGADNNLPFWLRIPMNLNRSLRARTVEEGARATLWAALGGLESEGGNGFYVADNRVSTLAPFADTPEGLDFEKRLWNEIVAEEKGIDKRVGAGLKF